MKKRDLQTSKKRTQIKRQNCKHYLGTKADTAEQMITYPISGADLSVAASGTRGGGELGDGDTLLTEADLVVSTLCPIAYEAQAHGARLWLSSEGNMGGAEDNTNVHVYVGDMLLGIVR